MRAADVRFFREVFLLIEICALPILMSVAASSAAWSGAFLELCEQRVVWGANFAPWDTIREWAWYGKDSTLRLRFRRGSALFRLNEGDRESVQSVIEARLAKQEPL